MRAFRRLLIALAILLALLAGAVVATDGPVRGEAERRVAAQLERQVPFTGTPEVTIDGWPFLWHLVTGFPRVRVEGTAMPLQGAGQALTLREPRITLVEVRVAAGETRAGGLVGTGRIDYADLSRAAGATIGDAGGGRISYTTQIEVFGRSIPAVASGAVTLDRAAQQVTITHPAVTVAGFDLPQGLVDQIAARAAKPFSLPLPYGLKVDSVEPRTDGLAVQVSGSDLRFPG